MLLIFMQTKEMEEKNHVNEHSKFILKIDEHESQGTATSTQKKEQNEL